MKKAVGLLLLVFLLSGCSGASKEIERGMALRSRLLKASTCSFDTQITADYGDKTYQFSMACQGDDQVTPVSAPWILLKTLRSGYLTAAGTEGDQLHLTIDDSYEDDALTLDIWLDGEDVPIRAEILYDGRRILSLTVVNFQVS